MTAQMEEFHQSLVESTTTAVTQQVLSAVQEESDALKADLLDRFNEMVEHQQDEQTHRSNNLTTDMKAEFLKMRIGQVEGETEMINGYTAMIERLYETLVLMRAENNTRYKLLWTQIDTLSKKLSDHLNAGRFNTTTGSFNTHYR